MVAKEDQCGMYDCTRISTHIIDDGFHICTKCFNSKAHILPPFRGKKVKEPKRIDSFKMEKIIETYLDLADVVQRAGGCVSLIKNSRDKPLSEFLEEVCSTNNIRFKHNKDRS
jgi:hypothetical protein